MSKFGGTRTDRPRPKLVLSQIEVGQLLGIAALALSAVECPQDADGDCEGCNAFRRLFWDLSNSLDRDVRVWYQHECDVRGIPLPGTPWETVDSHGTPTE